MDHRKLTKISIIIPAYNAANYIARCIESCLDQTLYDIEIICIDDGSTDKTLSVIQKYQEKDYRIKIISKKNEGVSAARNDGIKAAQGKWIMFVDSDDYLERTACEAVWKESLTNKADIIIHGAYLTPDYPEPESWMYRGVITRRVYFDVFSFAVIQERGSNPFLWLQAFSTDFLNSINVQFHEDISFGEDLIFQFETLPFARGISFIPDKVYYYRWYRQGSLMKEAAQDNDRRVLRHIKNIDIIASSWEQQGILKNHSRDFLKWALGFVIPDLEKLALKEPSYLAGQLYEVVKKHNLDESRHKLGIIDARQYRKMVSLMKQTGKQYSR